MDTKNVIAAISLSAAVIIIYGLFFAPEPTPRKINIDSKDKNKIVESTEAPNIESEEIANDNKISRPEALKETSRIEFENENVKGSISLEGGIIDDLTFKKYTETLNGNDQVILLNPRKLKNGYYIETGWATSSKNIEVPNLETIWQVKNNYKLTPNNSIEL